MSSFPNRELVNFLELRQGEVVRRIRLLQASVNKDRAAVALDRGVVSAQPW